MMLKVFSLLDLKTGHFNVPFFFPHTALAIRACQDLARDPNTTVARHPADFALCDVGTFDDQAGIFTGSQPLQLGTVLSLLPVQGQEVPLPLFDQADQASHKDA